MRKLMVGVTGVLFALSMLSAQEPTCKNCPGTYISVNEVQAYVKRAMDNKLTDLQIRAVDIGKTNLDVGVVYRGRLAKPAEASVAEHDLVMVRIDPDKVTPNRTEAQSKAYLSSKPGGPQ